MAGPVRDQIRHGWRVMNSDDWRYSVRGLLFNSALSFALTFVALWLVFRTVGESFRTALTVSAVMLVAGWWRSKHPPPPRSKADAAWYPDPSGKHDHRYWDGEHWTESVLDGSVQSLDW